MEIFNADCLEKMKDFKKHSIDCVIVDLPYGQTSCEWDIKINLNDMWDELRRICRPCANIIFFCTSRFGYELINSNKRGFCYDLVWEKSKAVGYLSAKKAPLRKHEMIYLFNDVNRDDIDRSRNHDLREYARKIKAHISTPLGKIDQIIGNMGIHHFYSITGSQFGIPIKKNYLKLTEHFELDKLDYYMPYEELKKKWDYENNRTYNPQMTKGKPYKTKGGSEISSVYGKHRKTEIINKGTRHPTSILKFNSPNKSLHSTQKPIDILEWLIKSYSNEGETVLDFTMGSGSTGVACKNTNRKFIGIEKDKKIFETAKKRLNL
jgi:DNA modification methylase